MRMIELPYGEFADGVPGFSGGDREAQLLGVADHGQPRLDADFFSEQELVQGGDAGDGRIVEPDEQVA